MQPGFPLGKGLSNFSALFNFGGIYYLLIFINMQVPKSRQGYCKRFLTMKMGKNIK